MARPTLPARDPAAQAAWVAAAVAAPFHQPRQLPRLVHPKREPAPPCEREPDLVDMMASAPEKRARLRRERAEAAALMPRSPLAEKRLRLRRERAAAVLAAMDAEYVEEDEEETEAVAPGPTGPDAEEVHAAIQEILPPGVPTYVQDVVAVDRAPGTAGERIIADIRMFDGALARIEINGPPGARHYRWHSIGPEGTACYWDEQTGQWKRTSA